MQPKLFPGAMWRHFTWLFLAHWLFLSLLLIYFFVVNGLATSEQAALSLIKEDFSLISTHTDKRRGNVFFSTPDYFLRLTELVPEADAFLKAPATEISFSYPVNGAPHRVVRELPLYLVGGGFFEAFNGRFIQGRGFERSEIFSGKPYVVMGEGALTKIFGDYNRVPSLIFINGVEYQVIGTWAFQSKEIEENEAIFLPLGLAQIFSKFSNTYLNNFILRGQDSSVLTRLKQAIDKIQLDAGFTPSRPEFAFKSPQVSRRTDYILTHNKVYLDVLLWLVLIGYIACSIKITREWMSFTQDWSLWSFMFQGNTSQHAKEASDAYFMVLTYSLVGACLTAILSLAFLKYTLRFELAIGHILHPSLFLYVGFFPIQVWLLNRWSKKLSFSL